MNMKDKFTFICISIHNEIGVLRHAQIEQLSLLATKLQDHHEK